jgi:hypothetical protein
MSVVLCVLCRRVVKEFEFWLFSDKLLYGELIPGKNRCNARCCGVAVVVLSYYQCPAADVTHRILIYASDHVSTMLRVLGLGSYWLHREIQLVACRITDAEQTRGAGAIERSDCAIVVESPAKSFVIWTKYVARIGDG